MAISKAAWEKMELLAQNLGVAEIALKYNHFGCGYSYTSQNAITVQIEILRQEIHNIYEREKNSIIKMR